MEFFIFDTNILLSALFNADSNPGIALKKARTNGTLLVSDEIVKEYLIVFAREKFNKWLSLKTRIEFIENIITNSLPIVVQEQIIACRDPKDDIYLSLAKAAHADCIVSGDQDLLLLHPVQGIPILNAVDFIQSMDI